MLNIPTLVSTVAGDIKVGDPITVNQLSGVGEKARMSGRVIGIAMYDLNDESPQAKPAEVEIDGKTQEIYVGLIDIKVAASDYTPPTTLIDLENSENRNMLERVADNVAGKEVNVVAIIVSSIILVSGVFVAIFLISSSSYSSMISIGRNPMARKKIIRSLIGLIAVSIGIFSVAKRDWRVGFDAST